MVKRPVERAAGGQLIMAEQLFDRALLRRRRARHRPAGRDEDRFFLHAAAERLLAERLADHRRRWRRALVMGLTRPLAVPAEAVIHADLVAERLVARPGLVCDDAALPCADGSLDLVVSSMLLHWANDPPAVLAEAWRVLQPDGLFLAVALGEESLRELRAALYDAEERVAGGIHPRVIPFIPIRQAGDLLQRTGFALSVVDLEPLVVRYRAPERLLADIHAMGEAQVLTSRPSWSRRLEAATLSALDARRDAEGLVPITFHFVVMAGFKPAPDQPRPARRGSGQVSLAAVLGRRPKG